MRISVDERLDNLRLMLTVKKNSPLVITKFEEVEDLIDRYSVRPLVGLDYFSRGGHGWPS